MIELAEFYLDRLHKTQDVVDLYPAVLATVHVPDWFMEGVLHRRFDDHQKEELAEFPEWRTAKDFANGLKHAVRANLDNPSAARSLKTERATTEYEHPDWWDHAGAPDQGVWQIEHEGQPRSIYSLCHHFLNQFKAWVIPQLPPAPEPVANLDNK
jgi:hypothetical protein